MDASLLESINKARQARQAVAAITDIETGNQHLVTPETSLEGELKEEVSKRFRSAKSGVVSLNGKETFIQVHVPSPRIVIIGAVHISQALVPMAKSSEFDITVIDPRTAFASEERFPGVDLLAEWPQEVLAERPLDPFTAMVAVTHDPKIDDIPLQQALAANCFYIGALGSRKTHGKRIDRFAQAGISEDEMKRIHAPIGLDIGAASPAEIAVSVMAEIIATLRQGEAA